jgi:Glycosyl hydrolases family 43
VGQQVSYGGNTYVSLANTNTGNTPPAAAWGLASSAGLPTSSIQGVSVSPTAPTQGQQLIYSGAAYTPTTVTAPLSSFVPYVSPQTPLYVLAHMRDDSQNLHIGYSMDGGLFTDTRAGYSAPGYLRDPSMLYVNGVFYFVTSTSQQTISGCAAAPFDSNQIQYFTSIDLVNFTAITQVPLGISGICSAWAPRFFTDPVSGNYYVTVFVGPVNAPNSLYIAQFTPATGTFGTFTQISLSGEATTPTALFDARIFYDTNNSTYYLFYCYEGGGGTQYIHLASSPTLKGGFSVVSSNTDPFGFGSNVENPDAVTLPNGHVLVYADSYTTGANGGRTYQRVYVNTSGNFSSIGGVQNTTGVQQEAGTIVTVTNPAVAALVYSASTHNGGGSQASPAGIDTQGLYPYKFLLGNFGPNALNANPTTGLGWEQSDGSIFGLWGCNAAACLPRVAGTGKLIAYGQPGPWSWMQFVTSTDSESSIAVAANCTPGTSLASCANSQSAWAFGTNTSVLGAANHKFFLFSAALQYAPLWVSPTTGETHATMGLTLGNQTAGGVTAMNASTGGIDSPAAGVTECNNGTIGSNNCQYAATDFVSLQAVSFAVTSAAGTGATVPTCVAPGYKCTPLSGVVLFTTGTAGTSTGDLLKIMWTTPRAYMPVSMYQEEDINTTRLAPQMDDGQSSTTQCVMYSTVAPTINTQYRVVYKCGI